MQNQEDLSPAVVVLNHKYWPAHAAAPFTVGATSFALGVASHLNRHGLLRGLILYRRDDALEAPFASASPRAFHGSPVVTLHFNFRMPADAVRDALGTAIASLSARERPIVYYQTDTLLTYHPHDLTCCVTHHGPFVEHFSSAYSDQEACIAYGQAEKVLHLAREQRKGLRALAGMPSAFVLQHSVLQARHLVWAGVPEEIIHPIAPPILWNDVPDAPLDPALEATLAAARHDVVLLSCVARVDYFKNLELLVDAGAKLLTQGVPVRVIITGGDTEDEGARQTLIDGVPAALRTRFHVMPRLDQPGLFALFRRLAGSGLFVCTSRYETLGITPLEAALSGVCTLSPRLPWVECSRYLSPEFLYRYTVSGLAENILAVLGAGHHRDGRQRDSLGKTFSGTAFEKSLIECWRLMSRSGSPPEGPVPAAPVVLDAA